MPPWTSTRLTNSGLNGKEYLIDNEFNFITPRGWWQPVSSFYNPSPSILLDWKGLKTAMLWLNAFPNVSATKVKSYDRSLWNGVRMREINSWGLSRWEEEHYGCPLWLPFILLFFNFIVESRRKPKNYGASLRLRIYQTESDKLIFYDRHRIYLFSFSNILFGALKIIPMENGNSSIIISTAPYHK